MKINRIIVKNLFNRFDYDFDFQNEESVSIFIGANASGKSTILNFISFMLEPTFERYQAIELVPFSKFAIELDNGYTLHLDYVQQDNFSDRYYINANNTDDEIMSDFNLKQAEYISNLKYYITEGRKVSQCALSDESYFNDDSVLDAAFSHFAYYFFADYYNVVSDKDSYTNFKELFASFDFSKSLSVKNNILKCQFEVKNYSEQYFKKIEKNSFTYSTELFPFSIIALIQAIEVINKNMNIGKNINYIATNRTDAIIFHRTVESLNSRIYDLFETFTTVISDIQSENKVDAEAVKKLEKHLNDKYGIKESLSENYKYIIYHNSLSYLEKHEEQKNQVLKIAADSISSLNKESVLNTYYENKKRLVDLEIISDYNEDRDDAEKMACYYFATAVFNIFIDKLSAFMNVNNNRLLENGKKLTYEKREKSGRNVREALSPYCLKVRYIYGDMPSFNIERLSSGEKNDLVMFYKLLFEIQANDLLIIDEPEISQHIELQERFIDEIVSIVRNYNSNENNSVQAIVATHSPHILNGHYNLLVNKKVSSTVDFDNE